MEKRERMLHLGILAGLVILIYIKVIFNGFVWDDKFFFLENKNYSNLSLLKVLFTLGSGIEYQPVKDVTVLLDMLVWKGAPGGMHFTNLLLFLAATLAVYYLFVEVMKLIPAVEPGTVEARSIPLMVAALFAVHPINGEAVNFLGARNVIMGGLFFFLSVRYYCRYLLCGTLNPYLASLVFFILALLCKATVIALPLLLLIIPAPRSSREQGGKRLAALIPYFILTLLFVWLFTKVGLSAKVIDQSRFSAILNPSVLIERVSISLQIPFFYLGKLFLPVDFAVRYVVDFSKTLVALETILSLLALSVLVLWTVLRRREYPLFAFGVGWFLATLIPVLNFYGTYPVVADRYAFIPAVGIFFVVSLFLSDLIARFGPLGWLGIAIVLLPCAAISFDRVGVWKNDKELWKANIASSPRAVDGYVGYARGLFAEGRYEEALEVYRQIKRHDPNSIAYELADGTIRMKKGDLNGALAMAQAAVALNPASSRAYFLLGEIRQRLGNGEEAVHAYEKAIALASVEDKGLRADAARRVEQIRSRLR